MERIVSAPRDAPVARGEARTKELILDAAERLFADEGVEGTSLRQITREAGVNLASVNYHFGSKEGLVEAVFARRLDPLVASQLAALDALEARAKKAPPKLEDALRALVEPAILIGTRLREGEKAFQRLMGRVFSEPASGLRKLVKDKFSGFASRLDGLLSRILPGLSREEIFWRRQILIGALHHVLLVGKEPEFYAPPGVHAKFDPEAMVERLVRFAAAGFRTPPEARGRRERGNR